MLQLLGYLETVQAWHQDIEYHQAERLADGCRALRLRIPHLAAVGEVIGRMPQLASISSRMRRLVWLSSTTSTDTSCNVAGSCRRLGRVAFLIHAAATAR